MVAEEEITDLTIDVGDGAETPTKQGLFACGGDESSVDTDITIALSGLRKLLKNSAEAVNDTEKHRRSSLQIFIVTECL